MVGLGFILICIVILNICYLYNFSLLGALMADVYVCIVASAQATIVGVDMSPEFFERGYISTPKA